MGWLGKGGEGSDPQTEVFNQAGPRCSLKEPSSRVQWLGVCGFFTHVNLTVPTLEAQFSHLGNGDGLSWGFS